MSLGKKNIVNNINSKTQISIEVSNKFLNKFLVILKTNSKSKIIKISGFGTFYMRNTPERVGRNPKTKESFLIPKKLKLFYKASNKIKILIN